MTTPNRNTTSTVGKGANFSSGDYMNAGYGSYQQPPSHTQVNTARGDLNSGGVDPNQATQLLNNFTNSGYGPYQQRAVAPPGTPSQFGPRTLPTNSDSLNDWHAPPVNQNWQADAGPLAPNGTTYLGGTNRTPQTADDLLANFMKIQDRAPQTYAPPAMRADAVPHYGNVPTPQVADNSQFVDTAKLMRSISPVPNQVAATPSQVSQNPTSLRRSPMAGQGALPSQVADVWSRLDALPHYQDGHPTQVADAHISPANGHPLQQKNASDWINAYRKANGLPPAAAPAKATQSPFKGINPNSKAYKDLTAKIDRRNQFSPAVLGTSFLKNGLISGPILDALSRSFAASGGMYGDQGNGGGGGGQSPATGNTQLTANDLQNGGNGGHNPAAGNTQLTANDLQNGGNGGLNPVIPPDIARFLLQMFGSPQGPTTTPFRYSTNLAA